MLQKQYDKPLRYTRGTYEPDTKKRSKKTADQDKETKKIGGVMNESWYIAAFPWKECPFKLNLVVLTNAGREDAVKKFKEFYKNDGLEIEDCYQITIITSEKFDHAAAKQVN